MQHKPSHPESVQPAHRRGLVAGGKLIPIRTTTATRRNNNDRHCDVHGGPEIGSRRILVSDQQPGWKLHGRLQPLRDQYCNVPLSGVQVTDDLSATFASPQHQRRARGERRLHTELAAHLRWLHRGAPAPERRSGGHRLTRGRPVWHHHAHRDGRAEEQTSDRTTTQHRSGISPANTTVTISPRRDEPDPGQRWESDQQQRPHARHVC